ncbi:MAG: hypothetical protein U0164_11665 [Gemmatimonadaceae bacterium]
MRRIKILESVGLATSLLLAAPLWRAAQAQIAVIVSSSQTQSITADQAAEMFGGSATTWPDGSKVQIVEHGDVVLTQKFYLKLVKKPTTIVRAQWTKLALSGQALAPKKGADAAAVKELVKKSPGAIGYIDAADLDPSVKEVLRVP